MLGGEVLFLVGIPVLAALTAVRVRAGLPWRDAAVWAFVGLYALAAADRLFFPLVVDPVLRAENVAWLAVVDRVNMVPFLTIGDLLGRASSSQAVTQIGGNIGLLLPLGLVLPVVEPRLRSKLSLVLAATLAAIAIEGVQFVATRSGIIARSFDIDDLALNVAGAFLGYLLWTAASRSRSTARKEREIEWP